MAENLGDAVLHLRTDDRDLEAGIKRAEGRAQEIAGKFDQVGQRMVGLGARLSIGLTAPLILFGKQAIGTASDAAELQSAFNVTFGSMSEAMNRWAETTGDAMGRSTQEMQRGANMFGLFFNQAARTRGEAAQLSQQFAVLAQDLSSFYNVDPSVALEKLRSGLAGEAEPLRDFGVFLTEATVKAKGLEMGLGGVTGELSEQEKVMARAALIMEATKNAQGDVARTSGGTANQLRAANAAWEELQVTIGTRLLPVITPLITQLAGLLDSFSHLPGPVQTGIVSFLGLATALGPTMSGIGGLMRLLGPLVGTIGGVISGAGGLGAALATLGAPLAALAAAAAPVLAIAGALAAAWALFGDQVGPVLSALGEKFEAVLGPKLAQLFEAAKGALSGLWSAVEPIVGALGSLLTALWEGPLGIMVRDVIGGLGDLLAAFTAILGEAVLRIVSVLVDTVTGAFTAIGDIFRVIGALLRGDFAGAWEGTKTLVRNVINTILTVLDDLLPGARRVVSNLASGFATWFGELATRMLTFGRNIIQGLVNGIMAAPQAVWNALRSVVMSGIDGIKRFLGIASPSLLFFEMGGWITQGLANGIRNGIGEVENAMGELGAAVEASGQDNLAAPQAPSAETGQQWREGFRSWVSDGIRAALDGDLAGFFSDWLGSLLDRALQRSLDSLLDAVLGMPGGGGDSGGGILGLLGSVFGGLFASGGTLPVGRWGIVGEKGPEPVMATPRGVVVRPHRALSETLGRAAPTIHLPVSIDATGADPAALERVRSELARLRSELPATIVSTVQEAGDRRLLRAGAWQ